MKPEIDWTCQRFDELSNSAVYRILALRQAVFVVEQNCPFQDADGLDADALHLCAWIKPGRELAAYLRILPPGGLSPEAWLARIVVAPDWRGKEVGKALLERAFTEVHQAYGNTGIAISAQYGLRKYYQEYGFQEEGEPYDEDGIMHIRMIKHPAANP